MVNIPAIKDILESFGYQLQTAREERKIGREDLAISITNVADKQYETLVREREVAREKADIEIQRMEAELKALQSVEYPEIYAKDAKGDFIISPNSKKTIDKAGYQQFLELINAWENGTKNPSETQYKQIKAAFEEMKFPLTPEEIEALDTAYKHSVQKPLKRAANQGQQEPVEHRHFAQTFRNILRERLDDPNNDIKIADFMLALKNVADFANLENEENSSKLRGKLSTLNSQRDQLPSAAPKQYFIVDGEGRKEALSDGAGKLTLKARHIALIEHGVVPSPDLYAALKSTLQLESSGELDDKYRDLLKEARHTHRLLRMEDPFNGHSHTPASKIEASKEAARPTQGEPAKIVETKPAETPVIPILVPPVVVTPPPIHIPENSVSTALLPEEPPTASAPAPAVIPLGSEPTVASGAADQKFVGLIGQKNGVVPASASPQLPIVIKDPIKQYAEAMAGLFVSFGLAHLVNDDKEGGARNIKRDKARTALADKLLLGANQKAKLVETLNVYNFEPIKAEVAEALVKGTVGQDEAEAVRRHIQVINATRKKLSDDIFGDAAIEEQGSWMVDELAGKSPNVKSRAKFLGHQYNNIRLSDVLAGVAPPESFSDKSVRPWIMNGFVREFAGLKDRGDLKQTEAFIKQYETLLQHRDHVIDNLCNATAGITHTTNGNKELEETRKQLKDYETFAQQNPKSMDHELWDQMEALREKIDELSGTPRHEGIAGHSTNHSRRQS